MQGADMEEGGTPAMGHLYRVIYIAVTGVGGRVALSQGKVQSKSKRSA